MTDISTSRKVLYTAVLLVATLGALEGVTRVRAWVRYGAPATEVRDQLLTYDAAINLFYPTPGYEVDGTHINIRINSLGFRGDEFTKEKPPNTVRIAVLGASTSFNAEVSSNQATWPHRLQEKLRTANPNVNVEVINAAVGGYISDDNLKSLRHRVLPLNPDLVIYYEANNEIVHDTRKVALQKGLIDGPARRSPVVDAIARYSLLFDLAHKNLRIMSRGSGVTKGRLDEVPRDLPSTFIGVLDEIRRELAATQTPLMLSTFIVKYRRGQARDTQIANADVAFYYMPWMSIDGLLDAMDVYNSAILQYASGNGLMVVDDRDMIPPDADHFTDCMHLTNRGAEVMAERFFRYLHERNVIPRLAAALRAEGQRLQ